MRVLLVSPQPDRRWLSMERYATRIQLDQPGIQFSTAAASHFNPPNWLRPALPRYRSSPALRRAAAKGADLVHITDGPLAHHRRMFGGTPTVATCHDLIPLENHGHFGRGRSAAVRGRVYDRAAAALREYPTLISVSAASRAVMERVLGIPPSRVSVVPVAVPWEFVPVASARERMRELGVALPDGPLLLSIGHAGQTKNFRLLLEALGQPALAGARLIRVSSPLSEAQRERAAALGVADRIHELGSITDELLVPLYSACDVLVQPSFFEGFGIPVAEAMACGLPVVCSEIPALVEVTAGAAKLVPLHGAPARPVNVDDARALADAIRVVIEDGAVQARMRDAGQVRAESFRPEAVAPLLHAAYAKAIAAG